MTRIRSVRSSQPSKPVEAAAAAEPAPRAAQVRGSRPEATRQPADAETVAGSRAGSARSVRNVRDAIERRIDNGVQQARGIDPATVTKESVAAKEAELGAAKAELERARTEANADGKLSLMERFGVGARERQVNRLESELEQMRSILAEKEPPTETEPKGNGPRRLPVTGHGSRPQTVKRPILPRRPGSGT